MPVYEFYCGQCGVFEKEMSMWQASSVAECPTCGHAAARLFTSVAVWTTPGTVRQKVEQGESPKVMTRDEWCAHAAHEHRHRGSGRPWQLGH